MTTTATHKWPAHLERYEAKLIESDKSPATVRHYRHDLEMFSRWYADTYSKQPTLDTVSAIDGNAYRSAMQHNRLSPSTINRRVAALRAFGEVMGVSGLTVLKPLADQPVRAPDVLTHAEVLRLMKSIPTHTIWGVRDFAIVQVLTQCGARVSEAAAIKLDDVIVTERGGVLKIVRGKGGNNREIPLNKTVRLALSEWLSVRPVTNNNALFLSQQKRAISTRAVQARVKKYLAAIGRDDLSTHSLRHLFATNLYNNGKDIVLVKELLGHRRLETTMRYSHKTEREVQESVEESKLNVMR